MKRYPAIDVRTADADVLYAVLDDFAPTAIEEREDGLRAFFSSAAARDTALDALTPRFDASAVDVPDEDWARRSQQQLEPITVGRITVSTRHYAPSTRHDAPGTQHCGTQHCAPDTQHPPPGTSTQHLAPSTKHPKVT
jgi:ribosomal protein L11 methylase PrmA